MKSRCLLITITALSLVAPQVSSADTRTFYTPGSSTFTVPTNVSALTVEVVGAGGGGGGGTSEGAGAGGGGGGYSVLTFPVTSGDVYQVVVGAGGAGAGIPHCEPGQSTSGRSGGTSSFSNASLNLYAGGGQGGQTGGLGGWGGPGGFGGVGFTRMGAMGGYLSSRWAESGSAGGASGTGAPGGSPGTASCYWTWDGYYSCSASPASPGALYGGGGGGTATWFTCDQYIPSYGAAFLTPGAGANGMVRVSYNVGGTVNVSSNISSYWTLVGPAIDFHYPTTTSAGTTTLTAKPSGAYNITWGDMYRYITPASQSLSLTPNGTITFTGTYVCANEACTSYPNACGETQTGTYNCATNSCSAPPPALPASYGTSCNTATNSCGDTNPGIILCNGCSTSGPPPERLNYGTSCTLTSLPNVCGQTTTVAGSGTIGCDSFTCTGTPPPAPPVTTPNGTTYGAACPITSLPNACGQTTTVATAGTYSCTGTCTGTPPPAPSNATCPPAPPTLNALYKNGLFRGSTVLANDPSGYQLYAQSVSPANHTLTYYFEWSTDGVNWTGDPLPPIGSWSTLP